MQTMSESLLKVRNSPVYRRPTMVLMREMMSMGHPTTALLLAQRMRKSRPNVQNQLYRLEKINRVRRHSGSFWELTELGMTEAQKSQETFKEIMDRQQYQEPVVIKEKAVPLEGKEPEPSAAPAGYWESECRLWKERYVRLAELVAGRKE